MIPFFYYRFFDYFFVVFVFLFFLVDGFVCYLALSSDEVNRVGHGELHDDLPLLLHRPGSIRDAFFRISSS